MTQTGCSGLLIGGMNNASQVQNNATSLQDYVEVKATWFDKDGKVVGRLNL